MITFYYNTLEGVKKYRDHPALSQSDLKNKGFKENLGMTIGSYLDCLVTMPQEIDLFKVEDIERPSDKIIELVSKLEQIDPSLDLNNRSFIGSFLLDNKYYPNYKEDTRIDTFIKQSKDWIKFKSENKDKILITQSEYEDGQRLKDLVLESLRSFYDENDEILVYFQKDFYWQTDLGVPISSKALADVLILNLTEKKIIEIDLKYTDAKTIHNWLYISSELNYQIQKGYYYYGLQKVKPHLSKIFSVDFEKIESYWLVTSPNFFNQVELIQVPDLIIDIGIYGSYRVKELWIKDKKKEVKVFKKGVQQLIKDYCIGVDFDFEESFLRLI